MTTYKIFEGPDPMDDTVVENRGDVEHIQHGYVAPSTEYELSTFFDNSVADESIIARASSFVDELNAEQSSTLLRERYHLPPVANHANAGPCQVEHVGFYIPRWLSVLNKSDILGDESWRTFLKETLHDVSRMEIEGMTGFVLNLIDEVWQQSKADRTRHCLKNITGLYTFLIENCLVDRHQVLTYAIDSLLYKDVDVDCILVVLHILSSHKHLVLSSIHTTADVVLSLDALSEKIQQRIESCECEYLKRCATLIEELFLFIHSERPDLFIFVSLKSLRVEGPADCVTAYKRARLACGWEPADYGDWLANADDYIRVVRLFEFLESVDFVHMQWTEWKKLSRQIIGVVDSRSTEIPNSQMFAIFSLFDWACIRIPSGSERVIVASRLLSYLPHQVLSMAVALWLSERNKVHCTELDEEHKMNEHNISCTLAIRLLSHLQTVCNICFDDIWSFLISRGSITVSSLQGLPAKSLLRRCLSFVPLAGCSRVERSQRGMIVHGASVHYQKHKEEVDKISASVRSYLVGLFTKNKESLLKRNEQDNNNDSSEREEKIVELLRNLCVHDRQIIVEGAESVVIGCIRYVAHESTKSVAASANSAQRVTRSSRKISTPPPRPQGWHLLSELPSLHAVSLLVRLTVESDLPDGLLLLATRLSPVLVRLHEVLPKLEDYCMDVFALVTEAISSKCFIETILSPLARKLCESCWHFVESFEKSSLRKSKISAWTSNLDYAVNEKGDVDTFCSEASESTQPDFTAITATRNKELLRKIENDIVSELSLLHGGRQQAIKVCSFLYQVIKELPIADTERLLSLLEVCLQVHELIPSCVTQWTLLILQLFEESTVSEAYFAHCEKMDNSGFTVDLAEFISILYACGCLEKNFLWKVVKLLPGLYQSESSDEKFELASAVVVNILAPYSRLRPPSSFVEEFSCVLTSTRQSIPLDVCFKVVSCLLGCTEFRHKSRTRTSQMRDTVRELMESEWMERMIIVHARHLFQHVDGGGGGVEDKLRDRIPSILPLFESEVVQEPNSNLAPVHFFTTGINLRLQFVALNSGKCVDRLERWLDTLSCSIVDHLLQIARQDQENGRSTRGPGDTVLQFWAWCGLLCNDVDEMISDGKLSRQCESVLSLGHNVSSRILSKLANDVKEDNWTLIKWIMENCGFYSLLSSAIKCVEEQPALLKNMSGSLLSIIKRATANAGSERVGWNDEIRLIVLNLVPYIGLFYEMICHNETTYAKKTSWLEGILGTSRVVSKASNRRVHVDVSDMATGILLSFSNVSSPIVKRVLSKLWESCPEYRALFPLQTSSAQKIIVFEHTAKANCVPSEEASSSDGKGEKQLADREVQQTDGENSNQEEFAASSLDAGHAPVVMLKSIKQEVDSDSEMIDEDMITSIDKERLDRVIANLLSSEEKEGLDGERAGLEMETEETATAGEMEVDQQEEESVNVAESDMAEKCAEMPVLESLKAVKVEVVDDFDDDALDTIAARVARRRTPIRSVCRSVDRYSPTSYLTPKGRRSKPHSKKNNPGPDGCNGKEVEDTPVRSTRSKKKRSSFIEILNDLLPPAIGQALQKSSNSNSTSDIQMTITRKKVVIPRIRWKRSSLEATDTVQVSNNVLLFAKPDYLLEIMTRNALMFEFVPEYLPRGRIAVELQKRLLPSPHTHSAVYSYDLEFVLLPSIPIPTSPTLVTSAMSIAHHSTNVQNRSVVCGQKGLVEPRADSPVVMVHRGQPSSHIAMATATSFVRLPNLARHSVSSSPIGKKAQVANKKYRHIPPNSAIAKELMDASSEESGSTPRQELVYRRAASGQGIPMSFDHLTTSTQQVYRRMPQMLLEPRQLPPEAASTTYSFYRGSTKRGRPRTNVRGTSGTRKRTLPSTTTTPTNYSTSTHGSLGPPGSEHVPRTESLGSVPSSYGAFYQPATTTSYANPGDVVASQTAPNPQMPLFPVSYQTYQRY